MSTSTKVKSKRLASAVSTSFGEQKDQTKLSEVNPEIKNDDIDAVETGNSVSPKKDYGRLAWAAVLIFFTFLLTMIIVIPNLASFMASVTDTNTSSTVFSTVEVWVFPMIFGVSMIVAGEFFLFRAIWRHFSVPAKPRQSRLRRGRYSR